MFKSQDYYRLRYYLNDKKYSILCYFVFIVIFVMVFYLYNLNLEPILYAILLCTISAIVVMIFDYIRQYKIYIQLQCIQKNSNLLHEKLPKTTTLMERQYANIIEQLRVDQRNVRTAWQIQRNDSIDYYSTWVHQIKTPIAVMHLILQSEDTAQNQELSAELFRIEQYVDMVLSYVRLDARANDFVFRTCSLNKIIKQMIRKYAGQFIRKRIALQYKETDIKVLTDEKWLSFLLEQVLSNAIKYTEQGQVCIEVRDQCIYIRDTGIGIAEEDIPRIFEKGFTGYNGHSNHKSSGIGLYLCAKAAQKLSHRMYVNSTVGKGTCITIDVSTKPIVIE